MTSAPRPGVKRLDTKQAADNHSPDGGRPEMHRFDRFRFDLK